MIFFFSWVLHTTPPKLSINLLLLYRLMCPPPGARRPPAEPKITSLSLLGAIHLTPMLQT